MTKPLVGVVAQMLIEEGKLTLEDPIAKHLPAFDNDKSRGITLQQVLSHTSGLPLSSLLKVNYRTLKGVRDVADLTGKNGPQFPPGSRFNYSDDGTDTVGAVVAEVSGQPLDEFIQRRLLDPLGMTDTSPLVKPDDPRLERFASAYSGAAGQWTKISEPSKAALFPYFLASQSLYSTPRDYAKFLALFLDEGKANGKSLLNAAALRRILTPAPKAERFLPTGFEGYRLHYGQLMMLPSAEALMKLRRDKLKADEFKALGTLRLTGTMAGPVHNAAVPPRSCPDREVRSLGCAERAQCGRARAAGLLDKSPQLP
jgi:CubicO group peptidase (beta-lactamase class C family)